MSPGPRLRRPWNEREKRARRYGALRRDGLRAPATASGGLAGHLRRAVVAEVALLRAAPGVRIRQAQRCAFTLVNFLATVVANEHGFPGHSILLLCTTGGPA